MAHSASYQPDTSKMTRVPTPAPPVGPPARPSYPPSPNPFLRTPLPPTQQLQPDTLRQFYKSGTPQTRIVPLPPTANATINASAKGVATTVAKTVVAAAPATVGLNVPSIFTPPTQTVTLPGPLSFSLATEPTGTVFKAPSSGLSSLTGFFSNNHAAPSTSTHPTITFTPGAVGWAFYMESAAGGTSSPPSGWSIWGDGGALVVSSVSPITATDTTGTELSWCNIALTFSGPMPSFVGNHQALFSLSTGSGTAAVTFSPTAGNFLIVTIYGTVGNGGSFGAISVSDSVGDSFTGVAHATAGPSNFNGPVTLNTFIVPGAIGGSTTVTGSISGNFPGGTGVTLSVTEVTPFAAGSNIPVFQPLASSDLPGISASQIAGGLLNIRWGGTGSNLSATGGAHKFLAQSSAGANVTVVQPDFSDLAGAAGAFPANYNGVATVSNGLPSEIAKVDLTAQGAAITATTLYAVPASGAGMYRVSFVAKVTTPATASSTLGGANGFQIVYTDADDSVVVTTPAWWGGGNNGAAPTSASLNTTQTWMGGDFIINAKASTNIQYQIGYTSSGVTTMVFNLHIKLEAL